MLLQHGRVLAAAPPAAQGSRAHGPAPTMSGVVLQHQHPACASRRQPQQQWHSCAATALQVRVAGVAAVVDAETHCVFTAHLGRCQ